MRMIPKAFYCLLLVAVFVSACSSGDKQDRDFYLYGDYSNTNGNNPFFEIDVQLTDSEICYDGIIEYQINPPDILLRMNNLSIYDEEENYLIDEVQVEEKVDNDWVWFPEFEVNFGNLTQLGVVLVLDVSESLGDDFNDVLIYAMEFVEIVVENAPEAQIGVVCFSEDIDVMPPSTNHSAVENFISHQDMGPYTKMYDAILAGINLLDQIDVDGRALVTFTDGRDNYSQAQPDSLVTLLNQQGIRSYTMGLKGKGGVNETVLSDLAVNGQYRLTSSKSDLRQIFKYFAESVSNVYQIDYCRSNQVITNSRQFRFKFIEIR